jgi:hypothetical protein
MKVTKCLLAIAILTVTSTSCCGGPYPSALVEAELTNISLCEGQTAEGIPIILQQPVPLNETRICICGHLEKNWDQDITLQVLWSQEGEMLQADVQKFGDGPFVSCVERKDGFEPGKYHVSVVNYKTAIGDMDFLVGE